MTLDLRFDAESNPDELIVTIDCPDPELIGHKAKLTLTAVVEVKDSRPVNGEKKLYTAEFVLSSASQCVSVPRNAITAYTYHGVEIDVNLHAKLKIDDGLIRDTTITEQLAWAGPDRPGATQGAKALIEPKDLFKFWANWRAIPATNKIIALVLAAVAAILGLTNSAVGVHDQFSPEGRTWFYSHRDSDGDGQLPLMNSSAITGGIAAAVWFALRKQLRKYMTFKAKPGLKRLAADSEVQVSDLFHGRSRVALHDILLRIVACNMEKGQYTRGSGTSERTVSFTEPVRGLLLFEKRVQEIPAGAPVERFFPETIAFQPVFDELYPPMKVTANHGVEVYWEIQLIHDTFVDQEIVGCVKGLVHEDFYHKHTLEPLGAGQCAGDAIASAPLPADFR